MYTVPKGWTNEGQKRGCFALHPNSMQAKMVNMDEDAQATRKELESLKSEMAEMRAALAPPKGKKGGG